ncbi:MAG: hypothetical protein K2I79_00610 [Clostridia bacterium]|nr:hypothetical protein [Clostridia bacterium]
MADNDIFKTIDELPKLVKLILCIPFLDVFWAVVRIAKGLMKKNWVTLVAGILWIFPGCFICWILDMIFVAMDKPMLFME